MVVLGLAGRIGTGKSKVSQFLCGLGAVAISADQIGHQSYLPNTQGWRDIVATFGHDLVLPSGEIDRESLGSRVFGDSEALAKLNSILHPQMMKIIEEQIQELKRVGTDVVVLEAALLFEANWTGLVDEVWVVTAPDDLTLQRVHDRNGLPEKLIRDRIQAQLPEEEQVRRAQVVIQNTADLPSLELRVRDLWQKRILTRKANNACK
jgi:dephospho-CoA kinase